MSTRGEIVGIVLTCVMLFIGGAAAYSDIKSELTRLSTKMDGFSDRLITLEGRFNSKFGSDTQSATDGGIPLDASNHICTYVIAEHECPKYTDASKSGGYGEILKLCGNVDQVSGHITLSIKKNPEPPTGKERAFGARPYFVRAAGDQSCDSLAEYMVIVGSNPTGVGTNELTFDFTPKWSDASEERQYCVTVSPVPGDPGYTPNTQGQVSWWYSRTIKVSKVCH